MRRSFLSLLAILACRFLCSCTPCTAGDYFEVQVLDSETRRGIPMVELITTDDVVYLTDSAGRVALHEPELSAETVFFKVKSPGYQAPKDGFGIEGVRLVLEPGVVHTVELKRTNFAERLYRITGRDIYLDTVRLGYSAPIAQPLLAGKVTGQDSIQPVTYRDELHWFWGDTNQLQYPLGLFRTAGAVSAFPNHGGLNPSDGINLKYFTGDNGFARAMVDVPSPEGVVWIHGVCVVKDEQGRERMIGQYSRRKGLTEAIEQGHVLWNDERLVFEILESFDLQETWRMLRDHPVRKTDDGVDYFYFGNPFPVTRVPATLAGIQDRNAYESWTCREELSGEYFTESQLSAAKPRRDSSGQLVWAWRKAPPVTQQDELRWLKQGLIQIEEARYLPRDVDADGRVTQMHSGTVHWNAFRKRWVMIAIEQSFHKDSPSLLGEVFYSEAETPQGPFHYAVKIATHPGQSFYNPCHHPFFDQNDGQTIYFEGTYCNTFTNSPATPKYNYNQLMYRLNLNDMRLTAIFLR